MQLKRDEERKKQEKLARERLEAARNRKKSKSGPQDEDEPVAVDTEDTLSLQEAIATNMDRRHKQEQQLMIKVSSTALQFVLLDIEDLETTST